MGALGLPDARRPEATAATPTAPPSNEIDIDLIERNPKQPREVFTEAGLEELAASIRKNGVLQPILVRPYGDKFQLVAGERRWTAAQRAGLLKIPAVVREVPDERLLEVALEENIKREQLNPMEEARAYLRLMQETQETQEQVAERLGKDRSTIANSIRLLKLPPDVGKFVSVGKLSPGHARALLASGATDADMLRLAQTVLEKGWSVRETERQAKLSLQQRLPKPPKTQDPNESAAAERLTEKLKTKVEILTKSKKAGELRIHFFGSEDLMRIYDLLIKIKE